MQHRTSRRAINRLGFGLLGLLPFKGVSARSQSSSQSTAQDPDSAAFECFRRDNTKCAVDVWEKQFALEPYNDQTRKALHLTLITDAMRSLDKGNLFAARSAFDRAKELVPSSPLHAYLQEALDTYDRSIYYAPMNGREFTEQTDSSKEASYVEIPGILGGQTDTLAITFKEPGMMSHYPVLPSVPGDFAMRYLVFPMSSNGSVITAFGHQGSSQQYFFASLEWSYGSSVTWAIAQPGSPYATQIGDGGYITIDPNFWHWVEIRLRGSTVELWVDLVLVGQQVVLHYEPGGIGFGVGLNAMESGTTFSAAFDDIAVYTLVD